MLGPPKNVLDSFTVFSQRDAELYVVRLFLSADAPAMRDKRTNLSPGLTACTCCKPDPPEVRYLWRPCMLSKPYSEFRRAKADAVWPTYASLSFFVYPYFLVPLVPPLLLGGSRLRNLFRLISSTGPDSLALRPRDA